MELIHFFPKLYSYPNLDNVCQFFGYQVSWFWGMSQKSEMRCFEQSEMFFQLLNHCVLFSPKWLGWQILSQNMGRGLATWPIINSIHQTFHDPESNIIERTIYHATLYVPLDVKLFCARYEYSCNLKTYQSVYQHQISSMIFMAYKPLFVKDQFTLEG